MGKLNSLERTIGLEFEFANPKTMADDEVTEILAAAGPEWVRDGSLREGGRELVTQPMRGDNFIEGISAIMAAVEKFSPEIDARCGFHVHVGAGDLGWTNLRNLIIAWCGIERDVFSKLVRADRKKNRYCIPLRASAPPTGPSYAQHPWQITKSTLAEIATLTTGSEIEQYLVQHFYRVPLGSREFKAFVKNKRAQGEGTNNFRYSAMNLHSFWYRHTIEFRLKEATLNIAECIYWPLFCAWFIENIAHMRLEEVQQITNMKTFLETTKMPKKIKAWVQEKMDKEQDPEPEVVEEAPSPMTFTNTRAYSNRSVSSTRLRDILIQDNSIPQASPPQVEPTFRYDSQAEAPVSSDWQVPPPTRRTR